MMDNKSLVVIGILVLLVVGLTQNSVKKEEVFSTLQASGSSGVEFSPVNNMTLSFMKVTASREGKPGICYQGVYEDGGLVQEREYNGNLLPTTPSLVTIEMGDEVILRSDKDYSFDLDCPGSLGHSGGLDEGPFEVWGITVFTTVTTRFKTTDNAYPMGAHLIGINPNCQKQDMPQYRFNANGAVPSGGCSFFGEPVMTNLPGAPGRDLYLKDSIYYVCWDDAGLGRYNAYTPSGTTVTFMSVDESEELFCDSTYYEFLAFVDSYLETGFFNSFVVSGNDWVQST